MEHLNGHVAIQSTETIEIEKITIHLQGERALLYSVEIKVILTTLGHSRVWIDSLNADGKVVREVSSYKVSKLSISQIFQFRGLSPFLTIAVLAPVA